MEDNIIIVNDVIKRTINKWLFLQVQVASDEKLALMSRAGEALARVADLERQLQDARARNVQLTRDRERDVSWWTLFIQQF